MNYKICSVSNLIVILALIISSCTFEKPKMKLVASYINGNPEESNYVKWVLKADTSIQIVALNQIPPDQIEQELNTCNGLLLTGGEDIHPARYGRPEDTAVCVINAQRDTLEFNALQLAMDRKLPILGICRGFQLLNVYFGGSLYADLPSQYGSLVQHQCEDPLSCEHLITIDGENGLKKITSVNTGRVTSNHHQGIRDLSPKLVSLAHSGDNLIEAFTWLNAENEPYMHAVQWHPERMDTLNPFSGALLHSFLDALKVNQNQKK